MSRVMKGSQLQDIAADVIAKHAPDIARGIRKSERIARGDNPSQIYNRSVQQLHQDLPLEVAAKEHKLENLHDRVDKMQAHIAKLEAKEVLNEKEAKRLTTYRKRLAARVKEYDGAKAVLAAKEQKTRQQEAALEIKEHVLNTAEDQLDKRETKQDHRDGELQLREENVTCRETILDRITDDISKMVNDIADRLGVGNSLRAIRDRLKSARNELGGDGPSLS